MSNFFSFSFGVCASLGWSRFRSLLLPSSASAALFRLGLRVIFCPPRVYYYCCNGISPFHSLHI